MYDEPKLAEIKSGYVEYHNTFTLFVSFALQYALTRVKIDFFG